jgi:5'-3' exoribonuclease 1
MGIPSYFRRIIQKYPGIVSDTPKVKTDALCFDFNCLIYRCIRQVTEEDFETNLLREVCKTVKEVWHAAGKPKRVFLAVDGVVPMAKIRQQRVRRFKSAWLRKEGWDSNAITPGTEFLLRISECIRYFIRKKIKEDPLWKNLSVIFSGPEVPGEGEHKVSFTGYPG